MYPTILALHSNLGKTLVGTRIRTLDSAYLYASQRGYKGAMYPWESAFVGKFKATHQGLCKWFRPLPRGYKTFLILNSAGHEIYPAHKC